MAQLFGWAFSPTISGLIQVNYGFGPAFGLTIVLYILSIALYYGFFWKQETFLIENHPKDG
jgi:dipeptide/tripeptide permease